MAGKATKSTVVSRKVTSTASPARVRVRRAWRSPARTLRSSAFAARAAARISGGRARWSTPTADPADSGTAALPSPLGLGPGTSRQSEFSDRTDCTGSEFNHATQFPMTWVTPLPGSRCVVGPPGPVPRSGGGRLEIRELDGSPSSEAETLVDAPGAVVVVGHVEERRL